jgi:hypothetical protein
MRIDASKQSVHEQQRYLPHIVGIDCAEGEVLCGDAHLRERVEQGALADIGQAHNAHLQLRAPSDCVSEDKLMQYLVA